LFLDMPSKMLRMPLTRRIGSIPGSCRARWPRVGFSMIIFTCPTSQKTEMPATADSHQRASIQLRAASLGMPASVNVHPETILIIKGFHFDARHAASRYPIALLWSLGLGSGSVLLREPVTPTRAKFPPAAKTQDWKTPYFQRIPQTSLRLSSW